MALGEYPSGEISGGGCRRDVWAEEVTRDCNMLLGRSSLVREGGREGGGGLNMAGMVWFIAEVGRREEEGTITP